MKLILRQHPDLDFFVGFLSGEEVPTKQDKFIPLKDYRAILQVSETETEDLSDKWDLYIKKKDNNAFKKFEESFKELIKSQLKDEHPYPKEIKLEVIIGVSMLQSRLNSVDIDNLIKSVLDCFNDLVYEDDAQVINVLGRKDINQLIPINGLFVGIRKVSIERPSWFDNIHLAYFEEE